MDMDVIITIHVYTLYVILYTLYMYCLYICMDMDAVMDIDMNMDTGTDMDTYQHMDAYCCRKQCQSCCTCN